MTCLTTLQLHRLSACQRPGTLREIRARFEPRHSLDGLRATLALLHGLNLIAICRDTGGRRENIYEVSALGDEHLRGAGL